MVRRHGRAVLLSVIFAGVIRCFVLPCKSVLRTSKLRRYSSPAGALKNVSPFWEVATDAASSNDTVSAAAYLEKINHRASAFIAKRTPVDREDAINCLSQLMATNGSLIVVLGGKNLGKTLLKEAAVKRCGVNLAMLEVDMRDADMLGKSMMAALDLQRRKSLRWVLFPAELAGALIKLPIDYLFNMFGSKNVGGGGEAAKGFLDIVVSRAQINVNNFIRNSIRRKKIPSIIVDEANLALPGLTDMDGSAEAKSAVAAIAKWTKQTGQASVMLISSEFGYPFRLMANKLDLRTLSKVIVIGEVPKIDMMKMLQEDWGMAESLAEKFYEYFGGDIYTAKQALDSLVENKDEFKPYSVMNVPGLPSLCEDSEARAHLENIARQGFSLVKNVETDRGARMIAEKNVGGVINDKATTFGLPKIFNDTQSNWAVIPSSYHMRLMIAHQLENTALPSSGPPATAATATPATPITWVRQLVLDEASQTFSESLPALQIKEAVKNVDDLKKAVRKEEELTIPASQILIFSRDEDGKWQQLTDVAAAVAENEVSNPYGFVVPSPPAKATTPASAVTWVRQLVFDEDNDRYEIADAQAFLITDSVANVALLKKAVRKEEELKIPASQILIFSRDEDGKWQQEEEDAEVNRGAKKPDSYGFVLPDVS